MSNSATEAKSPNPLTQLRRKTVVGILRTWKEIKGTARSVIGNEDVHPDLYGQPYNPSTYANMTRDLYEKSEFEKAKKLGKHIIGICRGSQFLCVMAGSILVQDQQNPGRFHEMETYDGKKMIVTSTHHQAAYPWYLKNNLFKVLGWTKHLSKYHQGGNKEEMVDGMVPDNKEVEICYYPKIKALGIQSHPEYVYGNEKHQDMIQYMRGLLNAHLEDAI